MSGQPSTNWICNVYLHIYDESPPSVGEFEDQQTFCIYIYPDFINFHTPDPPPPPPPAEARGAETLNSSSAWFTDYGVMFDVFSSNGATELEVEIGDITDFELNTFDDQLAGLSLNDPNRENSQEMHILIMTPVEDTDEDEESDE